MPQSTTYHVHIGQDCGSCYTQRSLSKKKMPLILGANHRFSSRILVAYQFDEDKHRYIYQKVSELDFHPSLRLGEVCEKIQLSSNHIPCLPTTVLLSYFHLSSSPMIQ